MFCPKPSQHLIKTIKPQTKTWHSSKSLNLKCFRCVLSLSLQLYFLLWPWVYILLNWCSGGRSYQKLTGKTLKKIINLRSSSLVMGHCIVLSRGLVWDGNSANTSLQDRFTQSTSTSKLGIMIICPPYPTRITLNTDTKVEKTFHWSKSIDNVLFLNISINVVHFSFWTGSH